MAAREKLDLVEGRGSHRPPAPPLTPTNPLPLGVLLLREPHVVGLSIDTLPPSVVGVEPLPFVAEIWRIVMIRPILFSVVFFPSPPQSRSCKFASFS